MHRSIILAGILLGMPALSAAGQSVYSASGDTLRFRDVSRVDMRFTTPQGEMPMTIEHAATIAVRRFPGDTAHAWYESLSVGVTGPAGVQKPATDSALNTPFRMRLDSRGRVGILSVPRFPASFTGVTDLAHQFDDFFLRLPAGTLRIGLTWSDTSVTTDSTAEKFMRRRSVASYRVERDTVVDGVRALVISAKQAIRINTAGRIPQPAARAEGSLSGSDEGFFVFAPRAGRLLGRRYEGRLSGDVVLTGDSGQMNMQQSLSYTNTLDAEK
jgi:hypothetical protein